MKKTLIALAAMAATGAFAQSSVSISGNIDMSYVSATTADGQKFSGIASGPTSTSKMIFSGVEDLGGGLKAVFRVNTGFAADRGATLVRQVNPNLGTGAAGTAIGNPGFTLGDRDLYIGLAGGFGEVRAGRNQSISDDNNNAGGNRGSVWTYFMANSGAQGGVNNNFGGTAPVLGGMGRVADSIKYASPVMGGFQVQALYGFGERDNLASEGVVTETQLSYTQGKMAVSYSMGNIAAAPNDATTFGAIAATNAQAALLALGAGSKSQETRLMASYDLGMAKIGINNTKMSVGSKSLDNTFGSVSVPFGGNANVWASIGQGSTSGATSTKSSDHSSYQMGVNYALSKRTVLYAQHGKLELNSTTKTEVTGSALGVHHSF
jgi:predicted porin